MKRALLLQVLVSMISCQSERWTDDLNSNRWIDLTHDFDSNTVYWPTDEPYRHDTVFYGMTEKGYFYSSFKYAAEEHGGTHFDAPVHFGKGQKFIHEVSVEQMHGPGVILDVTKQSANNRDYLVSVGDLENWETQHGKIPDGAIILLNTGFGKYWDDHLKYTGTLKTGKEGVAELHFPGLDPAAAKWLVENRKIKAIGLDTPSIDYGQSKDFLTHRILCAAGMTMYENVANLDQVPAKGSYIVALPMKIKGGSGAPLRIVAIVEK
ncbi:MAG: cyclase family protein [Bacteroidota bacterium]